MFVTLTANTNRQLDAKCDKKLTQKIPERYPVHPRTFNMQRQTGKSTSFGYLTNFARSLSAHIIYSGHGSGHSSVTLIFAA